MQFFAFGLLLLSAAFVADSRSLGTFYADDDFGTKLLKEVNDLYDNTEKAIDTLSKTGKDELVNGLEKAVAFVQSIGTKISNLKPTTDLGKVLLEAVNVLVTDGEYILNNELKNAKAGTTSTDDYKTKLVTDVTAVFEKAKTAYETLAKSDKKTLKEALTTVVGIAHELQTELNSLNPTTDVGKALFTGIQKLVTDIVERLEEDIKSIGFFYADDIEDALLSQVADLYDNAKKGIETLAKSGKTELVAGLQKAIDLVKSIEQKVKTLTPDTDLGKSLIDIINKLAAKGEEILEDTLKNAQAGTTLSDHKAELVALVKEVYEKAKETVETVVKTDKTKAKEALTKVIEVGKQIEAELKSINPTTDVGKSIYEGINLLANEIVAYLELQLKNIGSFYADDDFETKIFKEINDLYDNTDKAIEALSKTGKDQLVNGLEKAVAFVQSIGDKISNLKPTTDLGKVLLEAVNVLVTDGEYILNNELKNAKAGTTSTDDYKTKLVKDVTAVFEKAKTAYETLAKSDKKTLKEALTTVVGIGHELQTELNSLNPTTDVGKALFTGIQKLVNDIVERLEEDIKSIGF